MARAAILPPTSPPKKTGRGRPRTKTPASTQSDASSATKAKAKNTAAAAAATSAKGRTAEPKRRPGRPPTKKVEIEEVSDEDEDEDDEIGVVDLKEKKDGGKGKNATTAAVKGKGKKASSSTPAAGTGRGRKAVASAPTPVEFESEVEDDEEEEDELARNEVEEVPKRRVGRPRTKPVVNETKTETVPAPRGRGRPKGSKSTKGPAATGGSEEAGRKKRQVKGAAVDDAATKPIYITTNSTAMRSNMLRGPAKKKTVTFKDVSGSEDQDQEDEENLPAQPARRRRGTGVHEGMGAKPVRKTAGTATGTGRGRKPVADKKGASRPLSPKKATQVQKTLSSYASSDGEEDELSGAKDQIKLAVDSPIKHGSEKPGSTSPVRTINFTPNKPSKAVDENGEPTLHPVRSIDFSDSVYMSSPARRPPDSPFQFTMKETPRRRGAGFRGGNRSAAQPNLSPIQDSPLKSSPKKGNFGASSMGMPQPHLSPKHSPLKTSPKKGSPVKGSLSGPSLSMPQPDFGTSSPLKTSPKKGNLGASFSSQSPVKSSTPFAARSILAQSPAKRVASPFKNSITPRKELVGTPVKTRGTGNERRSSSVRGRSASQPPSKDAAPHAVDFGIDNTSRQTSPAASEAVVHTEVEDGPDSTAVDDAIEMAEEHNAEQPEQIAKESHPEERVDYDMEAHMEDPVQHADQSSDDFDVKMDIVGELEDNEENHAEYATYDCTYLQEEVNDNIEECQRHIDHHSEAEQMDEYEDKHSEDGEDAPNQSEVEMNQDDDLELVSERQSHPATPRPSFPAGFEDVFVDTPASHRVAENENVEENRETTEQVDELRVEELTGSGFEEQDAHNGAQDIEADGQGTPVPGSAASGRASPYEAATAVADFDEKNVDEPTDEAITEQDIPSEAPDMEEQGERKHTEVDEPEPSNVDSAPATPVGANEDTEQPAGDELEEPVDQDVQGQDAQEDDENTRMTVGTPEPRNAGSELASPSVVNESDGNMTPSHTPPPAPTPPIDTAVEKYGDPFRDSTRYSMASNDTSIFGSADTPDRTRRLTSPGMTPFKRHSLGKRQSVSRSSMGFTSLTHQLSQWKASSPGKPQPEGRRRRGVFSLAGPLRKQSGVISEEPNEVAYPDISKHPLADTQSLFDELPLQRDSDVGSEIYEDQDQATKVPQEGVVESVESDRLPMTEISSHTDRETPGISSEEGISGRDAPASQANSPALSTGPRHEHEETDEKENIPSGPSAPVTPMKNKISQPQTFHTVSKVPLKPEGEISPLKVSRKRGRSLSNVSPVRSSPRLRKSLFSPKGNNGPSYSPRKMPRLESPSKQKRVSFAGSENEVRQQGETANTVPTSASPAKPPRKSIGACSQVLQGIVAHVDVHTTEGEDASGIFIELLQQMGARCVKNWAWNPRSSLSPVDEADPKDGKVGITHVVFKDGGVRTLEKARQAAGLVKCVGVGWVLDCERESKWLDEMPYAVDSTIIPRGGAKRRKSMQPRVLSNVNGTLIKTEQPTASASGRRSGADLETMEDFMRLSPPIAHNEPNTPETSRRSADPDKDYCQTPRTPGSTINLDNIGMSPATPFFLQKANLVQQTCPPKESRQGLFTASPSADGNGDGELSSQRLRFKLEAARRKSQGFRPKIRSPLVG